MDMEPPERRSTRKIEHTVDISVYEDLKMLGLEKKSMVDERKRW